MFSDLDVLIYYYMYPIYTIAMMDNEKQQQRDIEILHYNHYHQDHQKLTDSIDEKKTGRSIQIPFKRVIPLD
jgi:hypothetical protein